MSFKSVILYIAVIIFLLVLSQIRKAEMNRAEIEMQILTESRSTDQLTAEVDSLEIEIIKVSNQILLLKDESKK